MDKEKIYRVVYEEATYVKEDIGLKKLDAPQPVTTIGRLRTITKDSIDLQIVWALENNLTAHGIVIPLRSVLKIDHLKHTHIQGKSSDSVITTPPAPRHLITVKNGDIASIYWSDVHGYHDADEYRPSLMITEGKVVKQTAYFIFIENPETLDLSALENHPPKKPKYYCIPRSVISEIYIL